MKITFQARIRAFLAKHGPATIDQVVAALGKHVTASQAVRCWERRRNTVKCLVRKIVPQSQKLRVGTRGFVMESLARMKTNGILLRKKPGVYSLAS